MKYLPLIFLSPLIWLILSSILYNLVEKDKDYLLPAFIGGFIFLCAFWGLILLFF